MDDFDTLQGQWRQVRFEDNGIIDPPDDHGGHGAPMKVWPSRRHSSRPRA
ncbi:hypothetical protein [Luteibacter sp. 22Crub2.1]|nr:hypothetical protein [Luteibacter sp. 22Crub2.1]